MTWTIDPPPAGTIRSIGAPGASRGFCFGISCAAWPGCLSRQPSYYFETRTDRRSRDWREQTRLWWDSYSSGYRLVTSPLVLAEFGRSPEAKSALAAKFFAGVEVLKAAPGFESVVHRYIAERLMPADATGDAAHLAMASMHSAEFLLTWNCRHLANANKQRHIRIINDRLGLTTPIITTPFELIPE